MPDFNSAPDLFIGFPRDERKWSKRFRKLLEPLQDSYTLDWMQTPARGPGELESSLLASRVVMILLSQDLLDSEYAKQYLLPQLITRSKSGASDLLIPITPCNYKGTGFQNLHPFVEFKNPLVDMRRAPLNRELHNIMLATQRALEAQPGARLAPAERSGMDKLHETETGRRVNAWIVGNKSEVQRHRPVPIGFNIGGARDRSELSAQFKEPNWGNRKQHYLYVTLRTEHGTVEPAGYSLTLPREGDTRTIFFVLTPEKSGSIKLRFQIFLEKEAILLQELETSIEVVDSEQELAIA